MSERRKMNPKVKMAVDFGPLFLFLAAFYTLGIMPATGVIIGASVVALIVSYAIERKLAPMPLVSGILITVFGGITLILNDPIYLIMKTTVYYLLVASALGIGLFLDKPFIKYVMGQAVQLPHYAWRILTWRWLAFFLFMASLNVTIYYSLGLDFWVNFKVIGTMVLFFAFILSQTPFMAKNQIEPETTD